MQNRTKNNSRLHDVQNVRVSLKQWRMLHAVIDHNGFSGAAEKLHLSQSAISYTIAKMEQQLGVSLFRVEGRKARITEEGRVLLNRSRPLLKAALQLESLAMNLRDGWGFEVKLVVDHHFPPDLLMLALRKFTMLGPNLNVSLAEADAYEAKKALHGGQADLAISNHVPNGYVGDHLIELEYVVVAHPDHALFVLGRQVTMEDLSRHVQVIVSYPEEHVLNETNERFLEQAPMWRVSSFDMACAALAAGLGYAWMPRRRVQNLLNCEELSILPTHGNQSSTINLYLVHDRVSMQNLDVDKFAEVLHHVVDADGLLRGLGIDEGGMKRANSD